MTIMESILILPITKDIMIQKLKGILYNVKREGSKVCG